VSPRVRAAGLSCAGAAHRRLGALPRALACFTLARALHDAAAAGDHLQVPLGPGQRAEDTYAAARVLIERGRPGDAWALLANLDGEGSAPATLAPSVTTLQDLERPASGPRRAQREALRTGALDRMQEIVRQEAPSSRGLERDDAVTFRAFPLDDEVVLLRRTATGEIVLARRTPLPRGRLVAMLGTLEEAMARQEPDDARWSTLAEPLARALAPDPAGLPAQTSFAMHGLLQRVPLTALPLPSGWLGTTTAVAWHPAGAPAAVDTDPRPGGAALFVVDPLGDLGLSTSEETLPAGARLLAGGSATRDALRQALPGSRWLHVDAHARFEPAFPDLSTVLLADGPVLGQELTAWASGLELANLSGCQTGRAPVTADSGRFGILGLLARRGIPWVVGARAALPNAVAIDFNRAFYGALEAGQPVPQAYRHALGEVSRRHPASGWAVLLLLHEGGGQSGAARTPPSPEGVR
ncbi:MAG TPA: CHAT domain-containing protein, partial [Candidatus Polarisedimenticolaceae bacterium]|nr:CHAT domain-containing protein [Candidatus Polarisedimenticolaceae bacterium]